LWRARVGRGRLLRPRGAVVDELDGGITSVGVAGLTGCVAQGVDLVRDVAGLLPGGGHDRVGSGDR